jgi:hypothetical protein
MFSSDGGDLEAGIQIGRLIRLKGFLSLVSGGARCASACALAWLGGSKRLMEPAAQVGFHAAYVVKNGVAAATSAGNALVGAYLNQIGLPDRAVVYITDPGPQEITWLNLQDAERLGIDVSLFTPDTKSTATRTQTPPQGPSEARPTPSTTIEETGTAKCNVPPGWLVPHGCSGLY